jgi:hypothetical protein
MYTKHEFQLEIIMVGVKGCIAIVCQAAFKDLRIAFYALHVRRPLVLGGFF